MLKGSKHARRVHPCKYARAPTGKKPSIPSRNSQLSLSPLGASLELRTRRKCAAQQRGLPHPHPVSRMPLGSERTLRASVSVTSRSRNAAVAICNATVERGQLLSVDSTARSETKDSSTTISRTASRGNKAIIYETRANRIDSCSCWFQKRPKIRGASSCLPAIFAVLLIFPIDIPLRAGLSVWDLLLRNRRLHSCCWGSRLQLR